MTLFQSYWATYFERLSTVYWGCSLKLLFLSSFFCFYPLMKKTLIRLTRWLLMCILWEQWYHFCEFSSYLLSLSMMIEILDEIISFSASAYSIVIPFENLISRVVLLWESKFCTCLVKTFKRILFWQNSWTSPYFAFVMQEVLCYSTTFCFSGIPLLSVLSSLSQYNLSFFPFHFLSFLGGYWKCTRAKDFDWSV